MLASEMREQLNSCNLHYKKNLSNWLKRDGTNMMIGTGKIVISDPRLKLAADPDSKITHQQIIAILEGWGYHVEYKCEDRPCGGCYFTITLPPGAE